MVTTGENTSHVSEMSGSTRMTLRNGPESGFVVDAVDALLRHDAAAARMALISGAEATGWEAIAHRLDVAGRALAVDAGLRDGPESDHVVLLPDLDTSAWSEVHHDAGDILSQWTSGEPAPTEPPVDRVWPSLLLVAWLVDRAGYPAEVVV